MSFGAFNKSRSAMIAAFISSLAVLGACDNSRPPGPAFAMGKNAFAAPSSRSLDPGGPPSWYEGSAPIIRRQIDVTRNRDWILASDGVHAYDQATRQKVGSTALPGWIWVGEPYGCSPALAIGPQGEAVISSDVSPVMWRVDPASFAVTRTSLALDADADKDIGFSGLVYAPEQGVFIATSSFHGSFWRIDPLLRTAQKLALSSRLPPACGWNISLPAPGLGKGGALSLCVASGHESRQISLASDLRTADVVAQRCEGRN